jgi:soluble P-type ATPase
MVDSIINKVCKQVSKLHHLGVYMYLDDVVNAIKNELQDVNVDEDYIRQQVKNRLKFKLKVA